MDRMRKIYQGEEVAVTGNMVRVPPRTGMATVRITEKKIPCLTLLRKGRLYNFHIKPQQCGDSEPVPGDTQQRIFEGMVAVDRIPFIEVYHQEKKRHHLIAVECLEGFEPA